VKDKHNGLIKYGKYLIDSKHPNHTNTTGITPIYNSIYRGKQGKPSPRPRHPSGLLSDIGFYNFHYDTLKRKGIPLFEHPLERASNPRHAAADKLPWSWVMVR